MSHVGKKVFDDFYIHPSAIDGIEDEAQRSVLNGLQLAYKVVANSVYGQTGSRTSPIRKVEVAACTTAAGRERLMFAKSVAAFHSLSKKRKLKVWLNSSERTQSVMSESGKT
jgi:DNA polymerase elongation subunit (family B)